jgi:cyclase
LRILGRIEVKRGHVVKGRQLEGVRKVGLIDDYVKYIVRAGITELHIRDVTASLYGNVIDYFSIQSALSNCFLPTSCEGGILSLEQAATLINCGVEKLVINSGFYRNPEMVEELSLKYGSQSVSVGLDCRLVDGNLRFFHECGRESINIDPSDYVKCAEDKGIGEFIVTAIDDEAMLCGPNKRIIEQILQLTHVPIVYGGGVSSIDEALALRTEFNELSGVALCMYFVNRYLNENFCS